MNSFIDAQGIDSFKLQVKTHASDVTNADHVPSYFNVFSLKTSSFRFSSDSLEIYCEDQTSDNCTETLAYIMQSKGLWVMKLEITMYKNLNPVNTLQFLIDDFIDSCFLSAEAFGQPQQIRVEI